MNPDEELWKYARNLAVYLISVPITVVFMVAFTLIWGLLWAYPVKLAWNYTVTYIFGLPPIGFWHAFSLLFVLTMLWKLTIVPIRSGD